MSSSLDAVTRLNLGLAEPLEFQAFSWWVDDGDAKIAQHKAFTVHIFGKDAEGRSVAVRVKGYEPTFYVKFPESGDASASSNQVLYENLCDVLKTFLYSYKDGHTE